MSGGDGRGRALLGKAATAATPSHPAWTVAVVVEECRRLIVKLDLSDCMDTEPCMAYIAEVAANFVRAHGCTIEQAAGQCPEALFRRYGEAFAVSHPGLVSLARPEALGPVLGPPGSKQGHQVPGRPGQAGSEECTWMVDPATLVCSPALNTAPTLYRRAGGAAEGASGVDTLAWSTEACQALFPTEEVMGGKEMRYTESRP